jgi:type II secretory pathway pseudopilin PulG
MAEKETYLGDPRASFTVTEIMVAELLLLIMLSTLLVAIVSFKQADALAKTHLAAQQIARGEAERLLTNAYSNVVTSTNVTLSNAPFQYLQGRLNCNVTEVSNYYKDITIAVTWRAPVGGRPQAVTNYLTICNTN